MFFYQERIKQRDRWIAVFKMKITRAQKTGYAQMVQKKKKATVSMVPKKYGSFLQMPIKHYATVSLIMKVPPKIHI